MSLPRYSKYSDSGVEWLGEVPSTWGTRRIRRLFEIRKRICGAEGYEVLSITQQGIRPKDIESGDGQLSADYSKYQFVEVGDFAMNHMDLLTGYVDISPIFGVTSPDYRVFGARDRKVCFDKYYLYLFQAGYRNKIFYAFGQGSSQLGRWRFPTDEFNSFEFPFPPIEEQKEISDFLDHETAKIDALVTEQHELISILKEKRQAVISHAVTRGLNPSVPLKDSGIEWLGTIPEHWEIKPLKYVASLKGRLGWQGLRSDEYTDDGPFLVTSEHFTNDKIDWDRCYHVSQDRYAIAPEIQLREGDLLMMKDGAAMGKLAYVDKLPGPACLNSHLLLFRPSSGRFENRFLYYVLGGPGFKTYMVRERTGTTFFGISQESIGAFPFGLPPIEEQRSILNFLNRETCKLDDLTAEAESAIALLQERRTALIYAAVTGKIDVRGLVGVQSEEEAAE